MPGAKKEKSVRKLVMVGAVLAMVWSAQALAGEERQRPTPASGTFVSAALEGDVLKWTLDLGQDAGKKTYEMTAEVRADYVEKEGVKEAQRIRRTGGREMPAKEGVTAVKGKFVSAKLDGEKVIVSIMPAGAEKAVEVTLPKLLSVYYREAEGKLNAFSIGVPRPPAAKQ